MKFLLNDLTDGLTHKELLELLEYHYINNYVVTRASVKSWIEKWQKERV